MCAGKVSALSAALIASRQSSTHPSCCHTPHACSTELQHAMSHNQLPAQPGSWRPHNLLTHVPLWSAADRPACVRHACCALACTHQVLLIHKGSAFCSIFPQPLTQQGPATRPTCAYHARSMPAPTHRIISGLMYKYVPVSVVSTALLSGMARDNPKSPRRATPAASMNTFEGFTSRCSTGG